MKALTQRSVRKAATGPQPNSNRLDVWGDGGEYDVGDGSAHEAVRDGIDDLLVQHLRHPDAWRDFVEMLDPNSSHTSRLHLKRRKAGNPKNAASRESVDSALKRICETPFSIEGAREIAAMLNPDSSHPFRLHWRKRNRGRTRREFLNIKIYRAVEKALESKEPIKNLVIDLRESDGINPKTFFEYKKIIKRNKGEIE